MRKIIKIIIILILVFLLIIIGLLIKKIFFSKKTAPVIDKTKIITSNSTYECLVFDGEEILGTTTLVIEKGEIANEIVIKKKDNYDDIKYFLMPGITDAHTHITTKEEILQMIDNGVTGAYDVASSKNLTISADKFNIKTSITTIMPNISDAKLTVNNLINQGAEYIKVMIDMPKIMGGELIDEEKLQDIVNISHKSNLKVAAHVTTIKATKMAVKANVDILIHIPIGEEFPANLAKEISEKNISAIPTLVMMEKFANSPLYSFTKNDYQDAKKAVKLLNSYNVPILVGTDSNDSYFVPKIEYGNSLYKEMKLLVEAGLTPKQVLQGTTKKITKAFALENLDNNIVLIEGRPDQNINDIINIRQIWINKKPLFEPNLENKKN